MKCEEFERRFQQRLDSGLEPESDEALRRHARQCDSCRQDLMIWQQIALSLPLHEMPRLPENLAQQVVADLVERRRRNRPFPFVSRAAALLAVAVVVLVALTPLIRYFLTAGGTGPAPRPQTVAHSVKIPEPTPQPPAVAHEPTPGQDERPATLPPWLPAISAQELAPVDQLAEPFRPVATSFNVALKALRMTIPIGREPNKQDKPHTGAAGAALIHGRDVIG